MPYVNHSKVFKEKSFSSRIFVNKSIESQESVNWRQDFYRFKGVTYAQLAKKCRPGDFRKVVCNGGSSNKNNVHNNVNKSVVSKKGRHNNDN